MLNYWVILFFPPERKDELLQYDWELALANDDMDLKKTYGHSKC